MKFYASIAFFFALFFAGPAEAQLLRVDLSGQVYQTSGVAAAQFSIGTTASAWFIYDISSPGQAWYPGGVLDPSILYYPDAPVGGGLTVGSYTATFNATSRIFVTDNESVTSGSIDRFIFEDLDPTGASVGGLPINNFFINFQGNASAHSGLALPRSFAEIAEFNDVRAALDFGTSLTGSDRASIIFDRLNVTVGEVPESESWAMLLLGFGVIGAGLRRYRKRREMAFYA